MHPLKNALRQVHPLKNVLRQVLPLTYIKQPRELHHDVRVVRTCEVVALRVAVDVAQAVVVAALEQQTARMRYAPLNAQASSDAVVELILHSHCVLRASLVGAVCSVTVGDGEVGFFFLVFLLAVLM